MNRSLKALSVLAEMSSAARAAVGTHEPTGVKHTYGVNKETGQVFLIPHVSGSNMACAIVYDKEPLFTVVEQEFEWSTKVDGPVFEDLDKAIEFSNN
jgi:hypothetical protein